MAKLEIYLLGAPEIRLNGNPVNLPRRKVTGLLIYLIMNPGIQRRDKLATLFWPESSQTSARSALRRELAALRAAIGEEWFATNREEIGFQLAEDQWTDATHFRQITKQLQNDGLSAWADPTTVLEETAALYRDRFLSGFTLNDCEAFDTWQYFEADFFHESIGRLLEQLCTTHLANGDHAQAGQAARRWVQLDTMHEPAHRALIEIYARSGQRGAALRQLETCKRILEQELGLEPGDETIEAAQLPPSSSVKQSLQTDRLHTSQVTPKEPQRIPLPSTSFVGRNQELSEIAALLAEKPECRLLTITGAGGVGKSRLVSELARRHMEANPNGSIPVWVSLENVSTQDSFIATIGEAIHFSFQRDQSQVQQLVQYLRRTSHLLILDGAEEIRSAFSLISAAFEPGSATVTVTTSRLPIDNPAEWIYPLQAFNLPYDPLNSGHSEAVELFMDRAKRAYSALNIGQKDRQQIIEICRQVDGLPLGIEMAANWVGSLPLETIASELGQNSILLNDSRKRESARHASLQSVLEHTWQLLSSAEQAGFAKLSIFSQSFSREAALRITGLSLVDLAALVRKSIITLDKDGSYSMLSLMRHYGKRELEADRVLHADVARKHSRYFGNFLNALSANLLGRSHVEALRSIGQQLGNVTQAWQWILKALSQDHRYIEDVDQFIDPLFHFFDIRSRFREGHTFFKAALHQFPPKQAGSKVNRVRGRICGRLGWFAFQNGDVHAAKTALLNSIKLLREEQADSDLIFSLNYLGAIHRHLGSYKEATDLLHESAALSRSRNDQFGLTIALNILGQIAYETGAYDDATRTLNESLALKRAIGDQRGAIFSHLYLGMVSRANGQFTEARSAFHDVITLAERYQDQRSTALGYSNLGEIEEGEKNFSKAANFYKQSLNIYSTIFNLHGMIDLQIKLGDLAYRQQDDALTQKHYRAAIELVSNIDPIPEPLAQLTERGKNWLINHA